MASTNNIGSRTTASKSFEYLADKVLICLHKAYQTSQSNASPHDLRQFVTSAAKNQSVCITKLSTIDQPLQVLSGFLAYTCLIQISGVEHISEYARCFPDTLIEILAQKAYEGVYASGFNVASKDTKLPIYMKLNEAWEIFWKTPKQYVPWEAKSIEEFRILAQTNSV